MTPRLKVTLLVLCMADPAEAELLGLSVSTADLLGSAMSFAAAAALVLTTVSAVFVSSSSSSSPKAAAASIGGALVLVSQVQFLI